MQKNWVEKRVHYTQDKNAETEKSLSLSTERQCERDESSSREEKEEKGNISNTATNKTCRCVWYLSRVCAVLEKLENNKATLDTHLTTCLFGIWPQGICETTTTTTWDRLVSSFRLPTELKITLLSSANIEESLRVLQEVARQWDTKHSRIIDN